ncbi:FKBP-type peptidyl-prolyl cis-trans isomerase (PPIase) [Prochlorococcus marinus subsp. pastoris str. CCMP1986]|uniref:Trigger factor n=1 Tax=Prochlorococcus marinus subsp. pastoris (strain CCMP1986 / NIES-2087 / MED4) TaxID=59919 RepID=TIG_PROMP|nr:trigger factor [Prochlorococcus marinus]Q7UZK8.1 RecName: Full=Trigger factor; Short=TF; AltName: Full=PPIase [Prochlorococcus marinus subsp. pastoris str. CCMP1986]KGF86902.1 Cell division trigger factor [Prochlorococcus marinus str. EQPAC1]CAE20114.1 FKBP-type peptidyl-prolyl cis-trans isomerase (PPIase) [Prochlorococcus marinus subsp. pastoris str. CCMP1986]
MIKEELIVKTTALPQSRIALELEIPSNTCKSCVNETINSISRSAKIPGFRLGKIPKQVLIQRIGITQLHASALEKIIDKSWNQALKMESIEPLSEPELVDGFESILKFFNPEKPLKITLQTDIAPEFKLKKSKGLSVEIKKSKFDPKSIDEALEKSRNQLANIIPVNNRPAKLGDIAVVSFKGVYKDSKKEIDGGSSDSMDLELEKNKMIPGFVEGIVGMKIDDNKTLTLRFPEDYSHEDSRGKEAIFDISLKDLKEKELPELNDDFAKQSGNKDSLKELKKDIEKQLKENFDNTQKNIKVEALMDALSKELDAEIPKAMIDIEVRNNIEQTAQRFAQQGMDIKSTFTPELVKSLAESTRPQAEKNVQRNLALKALSEREKITVDNEEIDQKMKEYEDEISKSPKQIDIQKLKDVVRNDLLQEKLITWLEENSAVKEINEKATKLTTKTTTKATTKKGVKTKSKPKVNKKEKN